MREPVWPRLVLGLLVLAVALSNLSLLTSPTSTFLLPVIAAGPVTPESSTPAPPGRPIATPVPATPTTTPRPTPTPTPAPTATPTPAPTPTPTPEPQGQVVPVPILMYHYVRPDPGPGDPIGRDLSVSPERFAEQMAWLAQEGYTPITLGELADVRARRRALPPKPIVLTFDDGYRDFYTTAFPVLRQYGFKATLFVITGVVGQEPYVTWDMIAEIDRSGLVEIGSHTVSHNQLPSLGEAQVRAEAVDSKQVLEAHLGHPVRAFCYPVGRVDARSVAAVRDAGYEIAVTTQGGRATAEQDSLLLPRVRIHGGASMEQFMELLS
ncbi:polysaccharide deacetylase family protein [Sphaerobacter sp.]|uniref:polysaccharide deacetylase family protein n=1 Tax=Sphaerobacter sp. TaxID=2099654 RepID=UPI001DA61775|nr:polysaccharide deacetylase family protein [Sphaerobacter sp.]MBX5443869.1 polysaccharide deacetylase family protein [Sphaerobacter sp.]